MQKAVAMSRIFRIATMCTVVFGAAAYATDYYVDANYGNDAWDGTTSAIPDQAAIEAGGTIAGPRKTLHAMMSDVRVDAGDTVWAAEGDYNEGGDVYGTQVTSNRVQVKGGVTLRASGSRDATFITGSGGSTVSVAYTNGAVRCVYFLTPDNDTDGYGIVKGFTIRDGRTASDSEHGGGSVNDGLMVDCDFQNNGCRKSGRGGGMYKGFAMRCKFTSVNRAYHAYSGTWIINSLILAGGVYDDCRVVNCTFLGSSYARNASTYNCLFVGTGTTSSSQSIDGSSKAKHYNTYSCSEFSLNDCTPNGTCRVVSEAETPYDGTTYRPLAGSVAIDAGDISYYVNTTNRAAWRRGAWPAEADKDYYGNDRCVNGAIDVGCGEKQPVEGSPLSVVDELDGLVVAGVEKGESQLVAGEDYSITLSRTLTSDRLCLGVMVNGVYHSFGGTTSDVPCSVTLHGQQGQDSRIAAVYETDQKDWYVSPTGNNANRGYHKNCPRRTLDKAMELATANAGNVVHAAAGVYDSFADGADARSRVTVKKGVGLVADEWPLRETVIKGAPDTTTDADENGNGPNAVRCVAVSSGGYVRGFKLTDGHTVKGSTSTICGGGAYLNGAALVDCEVTGNASNYRGSGVIAVNEGTIIRCNVHDQIAGDYAVYGGNLVDSFVDGTCYACPLVLNSTLTEQVRANSATIAINTYLRDAARSTACTNCAFTRTLDGSTKPLDSTALALYDPDTCIFGVTPRSGNIDTTYYRPLSPEVPLVDAGSKALYDEYFPAKFAQFKGGDFAGGQRIYNGQIDVGCGEYDFRPDFAGYLGPKAVVSEMGPNVTTNTVPNVVVPEGESITVSMAPRSSDRPTAYELVYTPEGGSLTVVSEKSTEPFSRTLYGACMVQSLDGHVGFIFQVR